VKRSTSTQTTLMYPARGATTVWEAGLGSPDLGPADLGTAEALLVDRQRSGRTVLYQASELGLGLLRSAS
jgi:hypothetical protein